MIDQQDLERRLLPQRTQALYLQAPVSNSTVVAIAVLYFLLLRDRLDETLLGLWTLSMIGVAGLRLTLWYLYRRNVGDRSDAFWLRSYTLASLLVGICWGLIQFMSGDFSDLVVVVALMMLIFGVSSSAVPILSPHMPAFFVYCIPQLLMLGIAENRQDDPAFTALSVSLLFYFLMLTLFARNAHRQFLNAQKLIIENSELVSELHRENTEREEIIQDRTASLKQTNELLQQEVLEREKAEEALRAQQKSLEDMAHHDSLTGLPNRVLLTDRISHLIVRAERKPRICAVLFIDLDHFKQINDSLGHSVGDDVLKAVAQRLLAHVRKEDTVARLGGDEFILFTEELDDLEAPRVLAEKILSSFAEPFVVDGNSFFVGASIGISTFPNDGESAEKLLRNADSAMYRAKADGRGAYRFYSSEMTEQAKTRLHMEADLQRALREQELELYFQPQVSLADGSVVGAEALLRWNHPQLGLVLPGAFIQVAEESTLINSIGQWVMEAAFRQLRKWQDAGLDEFVLAVNLSGRELWNNPLLENVDRILQDTGCSTHMLELEITESFLMQQPAKARELLEALRARGLSIAIDDFGTGYSSLSYLKQYPISKLKIDQSFVRDVPSDSDDQSIVRAIIALGHSLDLTVIGEGVEDAVQADFLRSAGCDQAQGFRFGAPMPLAEFEGFIGTYRPAFSPAVGASRLTAL